MEIYRSQFLSDSTCGFQRFISTLHHRLLRDTDDAPQRPYLHKFATPSARGTAFAELMEENQRAERDSVFRLFDNYRQRTLSLLSASASLHHPTAPTHRRNFSKRDAEFLRGLMTNPSITIKPADKNLGMVLVDTAWYDRELERMLGDTITYERFKDTTMRRVQGNGTIVNTIYFSTLQKRLLDEMHTLASKHEKAFDLWDKHYGTQLSEIMGKFLRSKITSSNCSVPSIYLLIKVHKSSGLCGRPIVPATNWLTTPPSVIVDHLLQAIVRQAGITHIVKDTKSFVIELEQTHLPTSTGVFVTADIASLYTNIDTTLGLLLVRRFLQEQKVDRPLIELIMSLLTFVMANSYLRFHDRIYHQIDGTAMGTACAPIYANIVVYMLEKSVIADMRATVYLYRRFLDDVFAYMEASVVQEFITRMNSLHPKLRFEFVTHESEASFLDLLIHKGARFNSSLIFDLSVHQKKMNLYLYIPFHSFHTDAAKRSFIQTELMRYIRNSSDKTEYMQLKRTFYSRLRDRGYPSSFLEPLFASIFYADRHFFLWPSAELHLHPLIVTQPPQSACLQRRYKRYLASQPSTVTESATAISSQPRPVFIIPYSPLSCQLSTRQLLMRHWDIINAAFTRPLSAPIIAYQSSPSLSATLVYSRAHMMDRARFPSLNAAPAAPAQQTTLTSFFQRGC